MATSTYYIKGITCNSCIEKIKNAFVKIKGISDVSIELKDGKTEIVSSEEIGLNKLRSILPKDYSISNYESNEIEEKSKIKQLFPLFLIFAYITLGAIIANIKELSPEKFIFSFMGFFFLVFSFFKILDLKGFVNTFRVYDPIAGSLKFYGWIYPFIELGLGLGYFLLPINNEMMIITIGILTPTTIGVAKVLLNKSEIKCACLGSVLNLPMTLATIIENTIMILMSIYMLQY